MYFAVDFCCCSKLKPELYSYNLIFRYHFLLLLMLDFLFVVVGFLNGFSFYSNICFTLLFMVGFFFHLLLDIKLYLRLFFVLLLHYYLLIVLLRLSVCIIFF